MEWKIFENGGILPSKDRQRDRKEEGFLPKWFRSAARSRLGRFVTGTLRRYFVHDVARQAAALAYYLLFAMFPILIFISSLLGLLELDLTAIVRVLTPLLPAGVVNLLMAYLGYVSLSSSRSMLWFGLVFSIWFPMRSANCLMGAVRRAYHLPRPRRPVVYWWKVLLYTVFLLVTMVVTLALMTVGQRMLAALGAVPEVFVRLWVPLRFAVLGVVVFAAVGLLYAMSQDERRRGREIVPGVVFAVAAWVALSAAYSFYVENFANYSLIYGTLGTVIVLLIWLYLTAAVLILGAEINDTLIRMRRDP